MLFKLLSEGKMKTFKTEEAWKSFVQEKGLKEFTTLRIVESGANAIFNIQLQKGDDDWETTAYLYYQGKESWGWTYSLSQESEIIGKVNKVLKDFVYQQTSEEEEEEEYEFESEENTRYSIYDVYSPSELGIPFVSVR